MRLGLKVWYSGFDLDLDEQVKNAAMPGIWWTQGYDFEKGERDIAFDYESELERTAAIHRITEIEIVYVETR